MFELFDYLAQPSQQELLKQKELELQEEEEKKDRERRKRFEEEQEKFINSLRTREDELRNLPNTQQRLPETTDQLWKERFGFSPVGKKGVGGFFQKLGAGLLEGGSRLNKDYTPIGEEAYKRASKNYEDEYKKLLGVERLESQQYKDMGKMYQDSISNALRNEQSQNKLKLQGELGQLQNKTKNRALDITQELGRQSNQIKAFTAQYDAMEKAAKAGSLEAKTKLDEFDLAINQKLGIDPKTINPSNRAMIFSKLFQDDLDKIIGTETRLNKSKEKPKDPIIKFIEEHGVGPDGNPTVNFRTERFDKSTGAKIGGGQPQAQNVPPNATPAQQIAGGVRQKSLGSEPVTPDGKYFPKNVDLKQQREIIANTPVGFRNFGEGKLAAENEKTYLKNREAWKTLVQRSKMSTQTIFDGIASGKTKEWQSAFLQNPIVKKFRDAFSDTKTPEMIVGQNEIFALLEHVRARYGTRPAASLLDEIGKTLRSDWDSPSTFAKKAGSISLMIQLAQLEAEDPRIGEYVDNSFRATEGNPDRQKSLAQAFEEEIEDSLSKSKQKLRNRYPTIEGVFRRLEEPLISIKDKDAKKRALGLIK